MSTQVDTPSNEPSALLQPSRVGRDGRSLSSNSVALSSRSQSFAVSGPPPGSFSSDLKSTFSRSETPRPDLSTYSSYAVEDSTTTTEQRQAALRDKIEKETKIKKGTENLLEALNTKNAKQVKDQKVKVEAELNTSNRKIAQLQQGLQDEIQRSRETANTNNANGNRLSFLFRSAPGKSYSQQDVDRDYVSDNSEPETESPTFVLAEILQALEAEEMQPEYYVDQTNRLVELFKRHPTLKYDLVWSEFGLRMQLMLLSDSREVVAGGWRAMRYVITDRKSLQTIRAHHTDYLVILSLVKESKASVEREQALKFVRAFLDVKDGVEEISLSVARMVVALAEHNDDRLKAISILTLAEILVRDPALLVAAGGIGTLSDALGESNYHAAQSLTGAFLYLLDLPGRRRFLRSGYELEIPFATFTESPVGHAHEDKLKTNAKVISALLKTWPGLITLARNDFLALRSLMQSLYIPIINVRNALLELITDVLRIKAPSWSSSFLAGRRLTTYARVTNLKEAEKKPEHLNHETEDETDHRDLVEHFTAVVLAALLHSGLLEALLHAEEEPLSIALKRKSTLVLGEVLRLASDLLPDSWSAKLQVLPQLLRNASRFGLEDRFVATGTIYQVDSVNRTLQRSEPIHPQIARPMVMSEPEKPQSSEQTNTQARQVDEETFRRMMLESNVAATGNFIKWRWDVILQIIDGPLLNAKRLEEAMKATRFIGRLDSFYRPLKHKFSDIKNTKPNQRYIRIGCALMRCLLQNPDGVRYLATCKILPQLAEHLAHYDRMSGITSESLLFTRDRLSETLAGGYFALLGAISSDPKGMVILERWRFFNIFYHIIEIPDRDDLIKALLSGMDYSLEGHLRIIISKAMTSCSKEIRMFSTRILRKYATRGVSPSQSHKGVAEWAIRLLANQLYDPEIEVCEVAIKILEEACNQKASLEYVVKCRPALDHLGEIGAPLLLRFLSSSVGYHYLDGLDYITREMDDWFHARNDTYVALVEASLARALADMPDKTQQQHSIFDDGLPEYTDYGVVPPHFYRELARTAEGSNLLAQSGHFDAFVNNIREFGMEDEDTETIVKVKGCLWAVGNVGSMELGAPFLERTSVVKLIVDIAEQSEVMTMRGTAFFVLGLVSRSLHGQEILYELGWDGAVDVRGDSLGFCLPSDFTKLFSIKPWASSSVERPRGRGHSGSDAKPTSTSSQDDPTTARILKHVKDLGNTVLAKRAAGDLHAIKVKRPPAFQSPGVLHKVMGILESHHFRLPMRRFVIDLFDKRVMRRIVLEEDDSSEEEVESEEDNGEESD
ncbi:hypothetical protein K402DRAFT_338086 [Aulographum hederae CBS 113979]|uniref:Cytosolic regulator pianissimo n=1 Tax=Aulographum hederae CBS 113979 TaxID=1176131 RepID=A0A6G1GSF5_9PEZI|nr:hypothetical protein K402DRAFT_338086 [Aulographum hederae CBS 113979]